MFNTLTLLPSDPIYGMQAVYRGDSRKDKINLSIGICLDDVGKLLRFRAIQEAERRVFEKNPTKEYLPITGLASFCEQAGRLVTGQEGLFHAQTVGGTGALFVGAHLLKKSGIHVVYIPEPTWPNHKQLFEAQGFEVRCYPYYNRETISLEFEKMVDAINHMEEGSCIILQASCHNPAGIDPTKEEWQILSNAVRERAIFPFFDLAYLGLGESLEDDVKGIRCFLDDDHELLIATTFAKSMGLYNERVGLLSVQCPKKQHEIIGSQIRSIMRTTYSSPPAHGAYLASELLSDSTLKKMWQDELEATCKRLNTQRELLYNTLQSRNCQLPYEHILNSKGLFCLLDIAPEDVVRLRDEFGIYVALDGRISLAAITSSNVAQIATGLSSI